MFLVVLFYSLSRVPYVFVSKYEILEFSWKKGQKVIPRVLKVKRNPWSLICRLSPSSNFRRNKDHWFWVISRVEGEREQVVPDQKRGVIRCTILRISSPPLMNRNRINEEVLHGQINSFQPNEIEWSPLCLI